MEEKLKREIVTVTGHEVKTPRDFISLSSKIWERTHKQISATTLKRFFGYLKEPVKPRIYTLDALSQFVGYDSYQSFIENKKSDESQSFIITAKSLTRKDIELDEELVITWGTQCRCVIKHMGIGEFIITESENIQLDIGDTFECHLFIMNEPLYLYNLHHKNLHPTCYVCGKVKGIRFTRIDNSKKTAQTTID